MAKTGLVYTVTDRSLLLPYYKRFIVEPLIGSIPARVNPNSITHFGHFINLFGVVLLLAFGRSGRAWPLYAAIACLQIYNFCDNADGAHARRTKQTSAMGELLDHGLDMLNTTYIAFAAAVAVNAPPAWWVAIALVIPAACATTYWEQAETGHFSLGLLNQIESVFLLSIVLLGSALFGSDIWHRLHLGPVTVGLVIMSFVCATAAFGMLHNVWRVVRTKAAPTALRVLPLFVFEIGVLVAASAAIVSPLAAVVIGTAGNVFFGVRCLAVRTAKDHPHHETGIIVSGGLVLAALAWGLTGHDGSHILDVVGSTSASIFFGAYTLLNARAARREVLRRDDEAKQLG